MCYSRHIIFHSHQWAIAAAHIVRLAIISSDPVAPTPLRRSTLTALPTHPVRLLCHAVHQWRQVNEY